MSDPHVEQKHRISCKEKAADCMSTASYLGFGCSVRVGTFLVPMESSKPIVEPIRVEPSKPVVVSDHSGRAIHPVSQLSIAIKAPYSEHMLPIAVLPAATLLPPPPAFTVTVL